MQASFLKCARCGHQWKPRSGVTPLRCASCKSPYWNRPRRGASASGGPGQESSKTSLDDDREWYEPVRPPDQEADEDREWYEPARPPDQGADEDQEWYAPVEQVDQSALLDLVEFPVDYRKRQEPMIKGKGTPVWALVSDSITGGLTPEEVSKFWGGYVTPEEVRAALAYWRKYPESVDYKLNEE